MVIASYFGGEHCAEASKASEAMLRARCGGVCKRPIHQLSRRQMDQVLSRLQKKFTYTERIRLLSSMFLGTPYRLGPLGEGPKGQWDKDPIFRTDRVDCVTYVETVLALARSDHWKEARLRLQHIRYKAGRIRFFARNHFTAAQWLPENQRAGFIRVITRKVGKNKTKALQKNITQNTWKLRSWSWWKKRLPPTARPRSYTLSYIPLRDMKTVVSSLPSIGWMGEVFSRKGNPISIQHVGFFVRKKGRIWFRHANRPRVQEVPLLQYAAWRMKQKKRRRKAKVIGFSFASFPFPNP